MLPTHCTLYFTRYTNTTPWNTECRSDVRRRVFDSHEYSDTSESRGLRDGQSAVVPGHKSAFAIYFPAQFSKRMSVVRPVSASVWQENRGQRTRVSGVAREWRNAKLNERVRENKEKEENGGGDRSGREGRREE